MSQQKPKGKTKQGEHKMEKMLQEKTWKSAETTVTPDSWVEFLLFILKMPRGYLLCTGVIFQIHGLENEKIGAWKHEERLQVWEGQMFFRPAERREKMAEWRVRKIKHERKLEEASREEKATSTASGESRIPPCFIPVRKHEESIWPLSETHWHFTQTERANEPLRLQHRHH